MPASCMHMLYTSHLNRTLPICHTCPVTSSVVLCFVCVIFLPSTLSSRIVFLGTAGNVIILQGFMRPDGADQCKQLCKHKMRAWPLLAEKLGAIFKLTSLS